MSDFIQLKGKRKFFIHKDGYVFKVVDGKEYIVKINIIKGVPRVNTGNEKPNLVLLMLEYFADGLPEFSRYSYKISDGKIPLKNINIISASKNSTQREKQMFLWKCQEKANAQNCRCKHNQKITADEVYSCLERTNFKCQYCGVKLKVGKWHLDHVQPLSNSGINHFSNITPSCKYCNLMKGSISLDKFLHQVKLISSNYNLNNEEL